MQIDPWILAIELQHRPVLQQHVELLLHRPFLQQHVEPLHRPFFRQHVELLHRPYLQQYIQLLLIEPLFGLVQLLPPFLSESLQLATLRLLSQVGVWLFYGQIFALERYHLEAVKQPH